jgi:hypothetical protein
MATFNPRQHLIQLKGKFYLETKFRIQWFREDHPRGCISTEVINYDPVLVKATVYDGEGAVLASAHAGAKESPGAVWSGRSVEKAETAAVGRALGHAGYGTQFANEGEPHDEYRGGRMTESAPEQRGNGNGSVAPRRTGSEDLREKDVASRFIQHWRGQALSDTEVLQALGVTKLSEWTKGRKAADEAVNAWMAGKAQKESA